MWRAIQKNSHLKVAVLVMIALALPSATRGQQPKDEDLIPPEILKQMDSEIRTSKRPIVAFITQEKIFPLRSSPRVEADFVRFKFDWKSLSTVQQEIVREWARSGNNRILLVDNDIGDYAPIIDLNPQRTVNVRNHERSGPSGTSVSVATELVSHPVNTDCGKLRFAGYQRPSGYYDTWDNGYWWYDNLPLDGSVVVTGNKSPVCGSFPCGASTVYFMQEVAGPDARRWKLNWWHWAMGLPVPGAADRISGGSAAATSLAQAAQHDAIVLKNGDTVSGDVQNATFTIRTSYSTLKFECDKIAKIVIEGAEKNVDVLHLCNGDKLSGTVEDAKITVKLAAGGETTLDKDKIKEIRIAQQPTKP